MATSPAIQESGPEGDGDSLKLNLFGLYFRDPRVEHRFVISNMAKALPLVRISLFFAAVLYGTFALLDYTVARESYQQLWTIRFGIVCPVLLTVCFFTFFPKIFFKISQELLSLAMAASGFGIIAMTMVAPAPVNSLYYAGLIMVVIYGSTLIRIRFIYSTLISVTLVGAYQMVALHWNPVEPASLIANNFFLVMATLVGIFASYIQELYIRRNWVATELLTREKERSEVLLAESRAANHAKSEFLAVVSHELRTPLNAIIGFSEFLKMEMFGPLGSGRYRSYAEDIYNSGQHLLEIINDILDLSRAEANKLEINEEEFVLDDVLNSILRMFRNKAVEDGVRLSWTRRTGVALLADQRLISQAVINLLSNAIKFTGQGGSVTLDSGLQGDDGGFVITVTDTGIGINESDLPKVIEPFVQIEDSTSRHHDGLGLGLPLVKRIIEMHGGELEIRSIVGKGTEVLLHIPANRVKTAEATAETGDSLAESA